MTDRSIIVDLEGCGSEAELIGALATALCSGAKLPDTWGELRARLETGSGVRAVVLVGLCDAERASPAAVDAMLQLFAQINNDRCDPRFLLRVGTDYEPTVYFLQGRGQQRGTEPLLAFISCWIRQRDPVKAKEIALRTLALEGWDVADWSKCYVVSRASYEEGTEERVYCEQAMLDGEVYVYDEWDSSEAVR